MAVCHYSNALRLGQGKLKIMTGVVLIYFSEADERFVLTMTVLNCFYIKPFASLHGLLKLPNSLFTQALFGPAAFILIFLVLPKKLLPRS